MVYEGTQKASNGSGGSSLEIPVPVAPDGSLLFMHVSVRGGVSVTGPDGWTPLRNVQNGTSVRLATFYRIANAEPASYTVALGGSQQAVGAISAWSGPTVLDVNGGTATGSSNTPAATSVTVTGDGLLIAAYAMGAGAVFSPPAGMTERYEGQSGGTTATSRASLEGDDQDVAMGATGSKRASTDKAAPWVGHLVAFR